MGRRAIAVRRAAFLVVAVALPAQQGAAAEREYSATVGRDYPLTVYWGDTHLHTRSSADAYSLGNMDLTAADAYRFARGQALTAHNGRTVRLRRPMDFLVVSDHAEYLDGYTRFAADDPLVTETDAGRQWQVYQQQGDPAKLIGAFTASIADPGRNPPFPEDTRRLIWRSVADTADQYDQPGVFTAFTGYEWTSMIDGNNLHRVVVYRDGADKAAALPPFSAQDSTDPRDLWAALARYEAETGGAVLAIAHNGNLSNGMMFPDRTVDGEPLSREYAQMRARWEPLYEVTQVKGDGEAHPLLSPDDEFADFENWDWDNIARTEPKEDWMLEHEYARSALKLGLGFEASLGVNPFKFGLIGSTDGHNSFSTTQEDNFWGKFPESEPDPMRLENSMAANQLWANWRIVASGYAAIWARENTREALFEAMQRREVYATTGSRITVRFFGGWDFRPDDLSRPAWLDVAYARGVPMGGDLGPAPDQSAPAFMVLAGKDPDGANLDRIQIVKGWRDSSGELRERVYDVVWSGERKRDQTTGRLAPVGSTVDVATASFTNTIGAPQLATVWVDPEFDPAARAFYYARVIEIPRPRWSTVDAQFFGVDLPPEAPRTVQDRAYTSPIWYTP